MVQALGRRYVSYFNYLHKRTGTLWEGRFRANAVQSERYLLTCQRYIELNPVRAGIVSDPLDFPWSSHRRLAQGTPDDLVTPHPLYLALAQDDGERRNCYRELFSWSIPADALKAIRQSLNKGWALASAEYCRQLERKSGRRAAPLKRGRKKRLPTSAELT
jgi:REP-associated tyrosine transposase